MVPVHPLSEMLLEFACLHFKAMDVILPLVLRGLSHIENAIQIHRKI
jgi:hypothetical protein